MWGVNFLGGNLENLDFHLNGNNKTWSLINKQFDFWLKIALLGIFVQVQAAEETFCNFPILGKFRFYSFYNFDNRKNLDFHNNWTKKSWSLQPFYCIFVLVHHRKHFYLAVKEWAKSSYLLIFYPESFTYCIDQYNIKECDFFKWTTASFDLPPDGSA